MSYRWRKFDFRDTGTAGERGGGPGNALCGNGDFGWRNRSFDRPSVMPGGSPAAWPLVKDLLQGIAANWMTVTPCCEWIGSGGAGHYVKMVHNGIEYGDMQLIAESYFMLRKYGQLENDEIAIFLPDGIKGKLNSNLMWNYGRYLPGKSYGRRIFTGSYFGYCRTKGYR